MDWTKFNTHGESHNHAFETMCNLIFEYWCKEQYLEHLSHFSFVNGSGGDGGVEAYGIIDNKEIVAVQSKWFPDKLGSTQISQLKRSFKTAMKVRPQIIRYIVCIPRDLGSTRIVKGGEIAKETEEEKWNTFVSECCEKYPNVKIELWSETSIQEKLTQPKLSGIYNFWFEQNTLQNSIFEGSFRKAVNSWANTKYIPDLYTEGFIHKQLELFLGSEELTKTKYNELCSIILKLRQLKRAYEELLALNAFDKIELGNKIRNDITILSTWIVFLENEKISVKSGNSIIFRDSFRLNCTENDLTKSKIYFNKYFHFRDVEHILKSINDDFNKFTKIVEAYEGNKKIIIGNPGCGKTTAIVSEISRFLENQTHLPILINAKDFGGNDTWTTILEKTLGLSSNWDEESLFRALECLTSLRDSHIDSEYGVIYKTVICVDAIDEAKSWEFWRNKIGEVKAYEEKFKRIVFVFLSRPYVFEEDFLKTHRGCLHKMPNSGDVEAENLCDLYFDKYSIEIGKNRGLKGLLRTPISVKLFCDIYRGKNVEKIENITTIITALFKKKIELMEFKYNQKENLRSSQNLIYNTLCEVAPLFIDKVDLSFDEIKSGVGINRDEELEKIVEFLKEEGYIYSFTLKKVDFCPVETRYSWGIQPAFDYLMAQKLYESLLKGEIIGESYSTGIYQMLALIVLENDRKFLFDYNNIEIDNGLMFELVCFSLANVSVKIAEEFRDYLKKIIKNSVAQFREIINNVVIPVCKAESHPLGGMFIDEILRDFESPAERDIWWSIPSYLRNNYRASWRAHSELKFEEINLEAFDLPYDAPLIIAWSLSSVNNDIRSESRMKLTKWGMKNMDGFWKLFIHMSDVNDEQILEDMFSIAYGIALNPLVQIDYLKNASLWMIDNIFSEKGLMRYENSALRYYATGIVKVAIVKGLIEESNKLIITPPYDYKSKLMEVDIEAIKAKRMEGYESIDYDLARYVLCDHLDGFFCDNHKSKKTFMNKYKKKIGLNRLTQDGLIISLAYKYLLNQGWDKTLFWEYKDEDNLGVDIVIRHTHFPSTHGEISRIMTVSEKYVWVFRYKIEAILANEVIFCDFGDRKEYINDYSQLENFTNMYQDYVNEKNVNKEECWFNTDKLAISKKETIVKRHIEKWMKEDSIPDFYGWILDNNGKAVLSTYTNVINDLAGITETVWISSGVVKEEEFEDFISSLDVHFQNRNIFISATGFKASQECNCYCTPQEACIIHPEKEVESTINILCDKKNIEVSKLITSCITSDGKDGEQYFSIPSKFLRETAEITNGDGYKYCNNSGNEIAVFYNNGKNWETQQKILLINQDIITDKLKLQGYRPFWIYRVYRSPSNKAYERYDKKILHDTDKTFLVWMVKGKFEHKVLETIKPPQKLIKSLDEGLSLSEKCLLGRILSGEEELSD